MEIRSNLNVIASTLPAHVTLVAVSKTKSIAMINEAYAAGHRDFGENKVQEMVDKHDKLPQDIRWHMIGHVQRNKVKYMAPFVHMIHGVDSFKLLKEIDKQACKQDRIISCLLQIKIAKEDTKFGMSKDEALKLLKSEELADLRHIHIKGLMGMGTFTSDQAVIRDEFRFLKNCVSTFKPLERSNLHFDVISMGMSADYQLAIEEGSTMIRVGSSIFGSRQ
ncbi:MAG: YggS family pyridoxal phosphate-dependent enzyme [Bacteroidia bacterium]|nr:YggS family pyridoxal phosphate-dependent enzyme [Bacteroidia bacterium]NNK73255.1 YggS family pyridoxal phosphate-dependent enzyme [Flavobacteriaceae bacterium]